MKGVPFLLMVLISLWKEIGQLVYAKNSVHWNVFRVLVQGTCCFLYLYHVDSCLPTWKLREHFNYSIKAPYNPG